MSEPIEGQGFWIAKRICPFCEGGALLFRATAETRVFVICDECDSCYLEPVHVENNRPEFPDNEARVAIADGNWFLLRLCHSASREEIENAGWGDLVDSWHPISSWNRNH
jgi:hypothetical protein